MRVTKSNLFVCLFALSFLVLNAGAIHTASILRAADEEISFDEPEVETVKSETKNKGQVTAEGKSSPRATVMTPSNPKLGGPRRIQGPQPGKSPADSQASQKAAVVTGPLENVLPVSALMMIRTHSLDVLERQAKHLAKQLGFAAINPMDYIKYSPYGRVLPFLNMSAPAAIVYLADADSMVPVFYLPVTDYSAFAKALGAKPDAIASTPDRKVIKVRTPANSVLWFDQGYAVLVPARKNAAEIAERIVATHSWQIDGYEFFPPALDRSDLILEVTSPGIEKLVSLAEIALNDLIPVANAAMAKTNTNFALDHAIPNLDKMANVFAWIERNVQCLRIDLLVDATQTSAAVNLIPLEKSDLHAQIQAEEMPEVPVTLDLRRFLNVVPDVAAPISGQIDLSSQVYSQLEAPFNRIRHIEYSLSLPGQNELLAESWCFFLEVDDSQKFVEELIVPKAELIGGHIGGERLSELGAQILGNLAVRRQARQAGRAGFPRRPANPEGAAAFGAELGEMLGSRIGAAAGVKQAMTAFTFDQYPLYVSDLALYTRQMRIIRAKQSGQATSRPILLTGEPSLRILIANIIQGLERGSLEGMIQDAFLDKTWQQAVPGGGPPLLAKTNLILLLDNRRILIVPGNEELLRIAKNNWEKIRDMFVQNYKVIPTPEGVPIYEPIPRKPRTFDTSVEATGTFQLWENLRPRIPALEGQTIRTVTRVEPTTLQLMADYLRTNYVPTMPKGIDSKFVADFPSLFCVSTTDSNFAYLFTAFPHESGKKILTHWMEAKTRQK